MLAILLSVLLFSTYRWALSPWITIGPVQKVTMQKTQMELVERRRVRAVVHNYYNYYNYGGPQNVANGGPMANDNRDHRGAIQPYPQYPLAPPGLAPGYYSPNGWGPPVGFTSPIPSPIPSPGPTTPLGTSRNPYSAGPETGTSQPPENNASRPSSRNLDRPHASVQWKDRRNKQHIRVYSLDDDLNIVEMCYDEDIGWFETPANNIGRAGLGSGLAAIRWEGPLRSQFRIYYIDSQGLLTERIRGPYNSWYDGEIMMGRFRPAPASKLAASIYLIGARHHIRLVYQRADNSIQELHLEVQDWSSSEEWALGTTLPVVPLPGTSIGVAVEEKPLIPPSHGPFSDPAPTSFEGSPNDNNNPFDDDPPVVPEPELGPRVGRTRHRYGSMDEYGLFSDPAPTSFEGSPNDNNAFDPPEPDLRHRVSRTRQYADPYAAIRAMKGAPLAGPPTYEGFQGYR
ncbi:hypothetical protein BDN72DRAFT_861932 [Pluteus cervinus]|uniref:Uncharacterized protein n=1 Tax=Pluteus cervinus TaxID=181527 RepID=A0ACD3ADQ4_9AGAR|nr:hypothetical protein BDN72DRAFT_861932 [Pluteus cervinus]